MSRSSAILLVIAVVLCCASVAAHGQPAAAGARVAPAFQASGDLPPGTGAEVVRARCTTCHGPALIVQQRLTLEGWSREVDKMVGWGAVVGGADRAVLLNYLSATFGVRAPSAVVAGTEATGAVILRTRCQSCHDMHLVEQQRLDAAGWGREVDKMIGWGAVLDDSERDVLVGYLAGRLP